VIRFLRRILSPSNKLSSRWSSCLEAPPFPGNMELSKYPFSYLLCAFLSPPSSQTRSWLGDGHFIIVWFQLSSICRLLCVSSFSPSTNPESTSPGSLLRVNRPIWLSPTFPWPSYRLRSAKLSRLFRPCGLPLSLFFFFIGYVPPSEMTTLEFLSRRPPGFPSTLFSFPHPVMVVATPLSATLTGLLLFFWGSCDSTPFGPEQGASDPLFFLAASRSLPLFPPIEGTVTGAPPPLFLPLVVVGLSPSPFFSLLTYVFYEIVLVRRGFFSLSSSPRCFLPSSLSLCLDLFPPPPGFFLRLSSASDTHFLTLLLPPLKAPWFPSPFNPFTQPLPPPFDLARRLF